MTRFTRRRFTPAEKTELWDRWLRGESMNSIGRAFGKPSSSIYGQLAPTGGIRPPLYLGSIYCHCQTPDEPGSVDRLFQPGGVSCFIFFGIDLLGVESRKHFAIAGQV